MINLTASTAILSSYTPREIAGGFCLRVVAKPRVLRWDRKISWQHLDWRSSHSVQRLIMRLKKTIKESDYKNNISQLRTFHAPVPNRLWSGIFVARAQSRNVPYNVECFTSCIAWRMAAVCRLKEFRKCSMLCKFVAVHLPHSTVKRHDVEQTTPPWVIL